MQEYILCNDDVCEGDLIAGRLEKAIKALMLIRDHQPYDDQVPSAYVDCKNIAREILTEVDPIKQ